MARSAIRRALTVTATVAFGVVAVAPAAQAVMPLPPTGCVGTTTTFSNTTPVAIADGGVVTSTIVVAGMGPFLADLDMQTFINHTFPGDLDITIQSPAGTVVTLTTDNGGSHDDVFNGTVWDDDANPTGQVPYTTNPGLVTDHPYVPTVVATPLAPEEPLGAFIGENPNGTWTLTVRDDVANAEVGTLTSWSLFVTTYPLAPPTAAFPTVSQTTPVAITDISTVTSAIVVAGAPTYLAKVVVQTFITHTFPGDLDITVQSPAGTVVTLTTDNGGTSDNVFNGTVWDDDANPAGQVPYTTNDGVVTDHAYINLTLASPLTPEEGLAAFIGENPNGTWTLTVRDDVAVDTGSIASWSLNLTTSAGCDTTPPSVTINQAAGQTDPTNTSPINFTVVFSEPVTGFATGDVSFTGSTAGGTLVGTVSGPGPTYNVAVTGMTTAGTVVATIGVGTAQDLATNPNTASTSTDNTVTWQGGDTTAPTCAVTAVRRAPGTASGRDEMDVTVRDTQSGLASITNLTVTNGTISITPSTPFAPGTTQAVVTAIKTTPGVSTKFSFTATDRAGNSRTCT